MNAMDDRSIVAMYLRRDETAVRPTAEKYGSRLRTLAYGIVKDVYKRQPSLREKDRTACWLSSVFSPQPPPR